MTYKQTTQVPNVLFDIHLRELTESELKILLVIIRQTVGWHDKATGKRKERDRITGSQFRLKTGLSKRIVTKTIQSLSAKKLIQVTDLEGKELSQSMERKGKTHIFYTLHPATHAVPTYAREYIKNEPRRTSRHLSGHIGLAIRDRNLNLPS